jgi:hypothetical protein
MARGLPPRSHELRSGFLVPLVRDVLKCGRWASIHFWFTEWKRRTGRWPHHDLVPFWFTEAYALAFLVILALAFVWVPFRSPLWQVALCLACYRLFDLAQGLARILFVESTERWDPQIGHYILVRDMTRWLLITLVNLAEIVLCFAFVYLTWGDEFAPELDGKLGAAYQSMTTFLGVGGHMVMGNHARLAVMGQLGFLVLFLVVVAPVVLSAFKAKQRTDEVFGAVRSRASDDAAEESSGTRPVPGVHGLGSSRRRALVSVTAGLLLLLGMRRWARWLRSGSTDEEPVLR